MSVSQLTGVLAGSAPSASPNVQRIKNAVGDYGLGVIFVGVFIGLSISANNFLTSTNLINIVRQSSIIGFLAVGTTFVMITAGIDLSIGSTVGLAGVFAAQFAMPNHAFAVPIVVGLAIGLGVGLVNSALIVRAGVMPFLATLAIMSAARGAALIYTDGQPISNLGERFQILGAGSVGGIPVPVILFVVVGVVAEFVLSSTKFGRHVYAIGGNPETARVVGIPVKRILVAVYVLAGLLAAVAGVVLTARVNGADPLAGTGYELEAIAAVVIGGTSLFGGRGTIRGTILGVLLIGIVLNGMDLLNVSSYYQQTVQGLVLVIAVLLNRWKSD